MSASPNIPLVRHNAGILLAISFALLVIGLIPALMSWVLIVNFCAVIMRASLYFGWYHQTPEIRTINLLSVLTLVALGWLGIEQGLLNSMVNLLASACSLKLMVMRQQKDYLQLFLSLVFLAGTGFIFQQGMAFVGLYTLVLILLLLSLSMHYASNTSVRYQIQFLLKICLQASPIAIVLFLVFPQFPPLWLMPSAKSTTTGISDTLRPGDIANLSQSSKLAFRAEFEGIIPSPNQRYWRALVLEKFDGEEWSFSDIRRRTQQQNLLRNIQFKPQTSGTEFAYRVYAEASRQNWLFTLDTPIAATASTDSKTWQTYTYSIVSKRPLMSPMAYDVTSFPDVLLNQTSTTFDTRLNLQLPEQGNPQTRRWIDSLKQTHSNDLALVNAILSYFRNRSFTYTLSPPLMQQDGIDAFLFQHKRGFCAHYASAMTFALRYAGIPARLVAGYQGGEMLNQQVMSVYQYDAHAWVEVWLGEKGWVRFDPTAVVAPNRLTQGLQSAIDEDEFYANQPLSLSKFQHIAVFGELRDLLGKVDHFWNRWILGFDKQQQQDLFKQFIGKITPQKLAYFMLSVFAIIVLFLAAIFVPNLTKNNVPKHLKLYFKMCQLVEQHTQIERGTASPNDYLAMTNGKIPPAAFNSFSMATKTIVEHEYKKTDNANLSEQMFRLRRAYRRLKTELSKQT